MSVNKVTAFGENLIDLTEDTVTKETLIKGVTAHDASGNSVTGTFDTDKYLEKTGDASNTTAVFSSSKERENISTGEKLSVIFGKIAKFFSDLKTVAFTGNYSDLSGTPSVVSKTADGLCPKNGGTTTKFLRDDGTYAVPTSSAIGLSTLEQVTAAATAGNVTAPVGAGALAEVNSSLDRYINYWIDNGYLPDPDMVALIPVMTSNTTPSGVASAISERSDYSQPAYYAFRGLYDNTTNSECWQADDSAGTSHNNLWLMYKFPEAHVVKKFRIRFVYATSVNFKIQGSNDGTTFTDLGTFNTVDGTKTLQNTNSYLYYRLYIVSQTMSSPNVHGGCVRDLQLYGKA